jgi:hypothetical protein
MAPPKSRPKEVDSMTPALHCAVRTARADDLQAVLDIHGAHDADRGISISRSDTQPEAWRRMMGTHDLTVYVAQIGVELVGTATALVMPNVTSPSIFRLNHFKTYPYGPVISALGIRVVLDIRPPLRCDRR